MKIDEITTEEIEIAELTLATNGAKQTRTFEPSTNVFDLSAVIAEARLARGKVDLETEDTSRPVHAAPIYVPGARAIATIGARYAWCRLDAPELRGRVNVSMEFEGAVESILAAKRSIGVGRGGSGKTSLFTAAFVEKVRRLRPRDADRSIWVDATELELACRSLKEESSILRRLMDAPLAMLDDIGEEPQNFGTTPVKAVVRHRHLHDLDTMLTTARTKEQLIACYGDGFARRITENADDLVVVKFGRAA